MIDLSTIPAGIYALLALLLSSPVISAVVVSRAGRRKTEADALKSKAESDKAQAEADKIIGDSYKQLLSEYRTERELMIKELGDVRAAYKKESENFNKEIDMLRKQQMIYMENSTESLKSNNILRQEVDEIKSREKACSEKNEKLEQEIETLKSKVNK